MSETAAETGTETTATETSETPDTGTQTPAPVSTETATTETETDDDGRVQRANRQAAQYRTELRATQEQLAEQSKTLQALAAVFNPDASATDTPDPAALTGQVEQLTTRTAQLEAELQVHTLASEHGANPVALLDSRAFTTTLHGLDPAADDYTDQVAKAIKDAVSRNASLAAAAGQVPSRGGATGAGQGPANPDGAVTQEQFDAMGYAERSELFQTNPDLYRRLAGTAT